MSGTFELEQACMLAEHGHEVSYIACVFHPFLRIKKWGYCQWEEKAVHIYSYSQLFFPNRLKIHFDKFQANIWQKLLSSVEELEGTPDIIHLHYPTLISYPETILRYASKGTRIVVTEHWTAVQTGSISKRQLIQLETYVNQAHQFICVGKPLSDSVKNLTNAKREIQVIPNIVPECFHCKYEKHSGFRFVAVGRLVPVKQFDHLITAFYQAYANCKDTSLVIVGDGSEMKKLQRLVRKLDISDQVKLLGTLSREQTANIISDSDALICYSRLETFGVPVIEAWKSGIPVIATTAIGFSEYWEDALGCLIPYDDDHFLIKSLKEIKENYNRYSKEYISQYADRYFSESAIYEKLMKTYLSSSDVMDKI